MNVGRDPNARTCAARTGMWLAGALVVLAVSAAPVNATVIEHIRFTQPYDYVFWDCGYAISVAGIESHVAQVRADKKLDGHVFVTDNYSFDETWTAPDGRSVTASGNGVGKDLKAKSLGGSLYEFTVNNVGQPFAVRDPSGALILRDRGRLSFTFTIDLENDSFNFLGVEISGPHPSFDNDVCKSVAPFVGTDSARYLAERPIGSTAFYMGYDEYLPPSYSTTGNPSPLLIFLNGYGENGDGTPEGIHNLVGAGIPRFINIGGWPTDRPLVVLALQHVDTGFDWSPCDNVTWGGSCGMQIQHHQNHVSPAPCTTPDEVHDFITYALGNYNVDASRVYVTGLSCGAFGAWEYIAEYGDAQIAAAVPIAGDGRPAWTAASCGLGSVPLWAFHGQLDDVVNPEGSIIPMTNVSTCPGVQTDEARLTVYPERDHNSWDPAYDGELGDDIYSWMLAFSNP